MKMPYNKGLLGMNTRATILMTASFNRAIYIQRAKYNESDHVQFLYVDHQKYSHT